MPYEIKTTAQVFLCMLLIVISTINVALAQERTVKGTVTEKKTGKPLEGASVKIKNSTQATVTNANGEFAIKVSSSEAVISITHVGFLVYENKIGAANTLSISLSETDNSLDDVVVVGYGTKKRANVLGAIGTINAAEIEDIPVANIGTALVNRLPGVDVSVSSGKPGATTTITIRNPTLFAASGRLGLTSDPLFVIDGLTVPKSEFDNLDASLIESISFLKDAEAAVYGASGAKGVVLVTTKKGKPGKAQISYAGYFGASDATIKPKVLSAYQHAKMLNDGYILNNTATTSWFSQADLDFLATSPYKSWYDEMWKPADMMRNTINVSGGTEKVTFLREPILIMKQEILVIYQ